MNHRNTSDSQENTQNKSSNRLATAALIFSLLTLPVVDTTKAGQLVAQDSANAIAKTEYVDQPASQKNTFTKEQIIKKSVRETLKKISSLSELPKNIQYTGFDARNLPQSVDIKPKIITKPVSSITVIIGDRSFTLSPYFGQITAMELTENGLILKTTFKNLKYDREEKLPALFRMLWNTPHGKGEKKGFLLTTVIEV